MPIDVGNGGGAVVYAGEARAGGLERAIGLLEVKRRDRAVGILPGDEEVGPVLPVDVGDGGRTEVHASEACARGLERAIRLLEVERRDLVEVGIEASNKQVGSVLPVDVGNGGGTEAYAGEGRAGSREKGGRGRHERIGGFRCCRRHHRAYSTALKRLRVHLL